MNKYFKTFENFNQNYTILYRGDSKKIDSFSEEFFDLYALFGKGLYLTDDYEIADTYTTKGDDKAILFKIHFDNIEYGRGDYQKHNNPLQYCKNMFITEYLIPKLTDKFDNDDLHRFSDCITDKSYNEVINVKNYEQLYKLRFSGEINKTSEWFDESYEIKNFELFSEIRKYYIEASKLFLTEFSDVKFIPSQLTKHDNVYKVVRPSHIEGGVTKFKVSNEILAKCFDTEIKYEEIEKEIKSIIKKIITVFNKEQTNDRRKEKFDSFYNYIAQDFEETLCENMYPIKNRIRNLGDKYLEMFWNLFISLLKKQGYKGFRYNGGVMTGNKFHNAYSIWSLNDVEKIN